MSQKFSSEIHASARCGPVDSRDYCNVYLPCGHCLFTQCLFTQGRQSLFLTADCSSPRMCCRMLCALSSAAHMCLLSGFLSYALRSGRNGTYVHVRHGIGCLQPSGFPIKNSVFGLEKHYPSLALDTFLKVYTIHPVKFQRSDIHSIYVKRPSVTNIIEQNTNKQK